MTYTTLSSYENIYMKKVLLCLLLATQLCHAQFTGDYKSSNFKSFDHNSNGSITFNGSTLILNGTNNLSGNSGMNSMWIIVKNTGVIKFTYEISSIDSRGATGQYDEFGIFDKDFSKTKPLGWDVTTSPQTVSINVTKGNIFSFYLSSKDNNSGAMNVKVSNFSYSATVLPIKLISFTGLTNTLNVNTLNWSASTEINTKSFEIERSLDGLNYLKVGSVVASVTSVNTINYNFDDKYNFLQGSTYFYRLKMIDQDMDFTYSPVITLNGKGKPVIAVSPNPFTDKITVSVSSYAAGVAKMELTDIKGRKVLEQTKSIQAGTNSVAIILTPGILKGIYFLHVSTANTTTTVKIIKQ